MDNLHVQNNLSIDSLDSLNRYISAQNNSHTYSYFSNIPQDVLNKPCILGIDEAGRGPVLGPMVYGIAFCPVDEAEILKTIGCADSKELTEEKREIIFEKICSSSNNIGWSVDVISPNSICNSMLSRTKHSLNAVSMDSVVGLIKSVMRAHITIAHIYVDTVGKPEKYQAYLLNIFPDFKITVEKKADSTFPIVSAASISAKVTRDHALKMWKFPEGIELTHESFGSGYPADPVTKQFLRDYCEPVFGFPQLVRFSWSTASKVLDEHAYPVEWENIEETTTPADNTSITSFFKMVTPKSVKRHQKSHEFFTQRGLNNVREF